MCASQRATRPPKPHEVLTFHSRRLLLCLSANASESDWATFESQIFRFRDPLNRQHRFIPLRLDRAPIEGSLAQFSYVNWTTEDREINYPTASCWETRRPWPGAGRVQEPLTIVSSATIGWQGG